MNQHTHLALAFMTCLALVGSSAGSPVSSPVDGTDSNLTGTQVLNGIEYLTGSNAQKLDLYRPSAMVSGTRYPAIVIIHGGGWSGGHRADGREQNFARTLSHAGYICASIEYTLATKDRHTWPQVLYQCKSAVAFLRKNAEAYQIDPDHIGAMGGSAGGHLALMVGLTSASGKLQPPRPYPQSSSRVQAVADFYGPTDLVTLGLDKYCEMMLGINKILGRRAWEEASPINYVTAMSPPVLVVQGTKDSAVPVSQSEELSKKLEIQKVPHQLVLVSGAEHSFDLTPPQQDLRPIVIGFFDKYLKGKK